jgi:hypothetical protein
MVRLDSKKKTLILDLKNDTSKQLAEMVLQAIYLYGAESDEDKAILRQMARMVKGEEPAVNINLKDYLKSQETSNDRVQ